MPEGSQKRKATRVRSLRQRWIVNSVVPIFVLLALIVGGVSLGISNYYYKGMLDGLERQARAQSGAFVDYFMDQGFANYLQRANQAISDYADKERVEMQFLSSVGRIQASSTSNLTVGTRPGTEDISRAVETNRISYFRGADPKTGEQILAVSHPLTVNGKVVGVLRFVTSLRQVNVQVRMTVLAVVLVALLCLLLVLSSNLIFINNVVEPVAVVSDAAKRISQGSYGFTLENKYTGELGELVDNINDMPERENENGIYLVGVPRAADAAHSHQRLGRNAAGRPGAGSDPAPPGPADHPQRVPAALDHGGGAAGVFQDGGWPLYAAAGRNGSSGRV